MQEAVTQDYPVPVARCDDAATSDSGSTDSGTGAGTEVRGDAEECATDPCAGGRPADDTTICVDDVKITGGSGTSTSRSPCEAGIAADCDSFAVSSCAPGVVLPSGQCGLPLNGVSASDPLAGALLLVAAGVGLLRLGRARTRA